MYLLRLRLTWVQCQEIILGRKFKYFSNTTIWWHTIHYYWVAMAWMFSRVRSKCWEKRKGPVSLNFISLPLFNSYENRKSFQRPFHILRNSYDRQNIEIQSIDDVTVTRALALLIQTINMAERERKQNWSATEITVLPL